VGVEAGASLTGEIRIVEFAADELRPPLSFTTHVIVRLTEVAVGFSDVELKVTERKAL
jgi:hypothetical protein